MTTPPDPVALPEWLAFIVAIAPFGSLVLAFVAGGVAVTSLGIAISGRNTARKSLAIAQRQEARAGDMVEIYLRRARQTLAADGSTVLLNVEVTNQSHTGIWLRKAALWIVHQAGGQSISSEVSPSEPPPGSDPALVFPLELKARQVTDGWLAFQISRARTNGEPVIRQSLTLTDTDGNEWTLPDFKAGR